MPTARLLMNNQESASNRIARQINRNLIFNHIRVRQPISRADLARASGLQRSTVSLIVEELLADRWIEEGSIGHIPRGRKPTFLHLNDKRVVLTLDVHPTQIALAVIAISGKVVAEDLLTLPSDPSKVIATIVRHVRRLITTHAELTFEGIGMSLPGRFNPSIETSIFAPNIPWPLGQLKARLEAATGLPTAADNVANACALSEVWFGYSAAQSNLVAVNVSEGIGAGIFANGQLLRGEGGVAGEFGHIQIDPKGPICGCGGKGCLETIASNRAGLRYYAQIARHELQSFDNLLELVRNGDRNALKALDLMCQALGRGMHMIALAVAPGEIVIVGDITTLWDIAGPRIEAEMRSYPLVLAPKLRPALEGNKARLRSGVALVMSSKRV
ncbi:ROK family protein [Acidicapsa dinghuensis]|uniref:ROK family protein n=1 Tax=Acidicapsa dinghuensis TaxID=2218256 RepID=A0ABW1EGW3_9BACT|nr:ROK family transcriptional regulator [Acidicapsa dinghuensis]